MQRYGAIDRVRLGDVSSKNYVLYIFIKNYLIIKSTWLFLSCYHSLGGKAVISRRPLWYTDICKDLDQLGKLIYSVVAANCRKTAETLFLIHLSVVDWHKGKCLYKFVDHKCHSSIIGLLFNSTGRSIFRSRQATVSGCLGHCQLLTEAKKRNRSILKLMSDAKSTFNNLLSGAPLVLLRRIKENIADTALHTRYYEKMRDCRWALWWGFILALATLTCRLLLIMWTHSSFSHTAV